MVMNRTLIVTIRHKPYAGNERYIFVSYAHKDGKKAERVIATLQDAGYRVWYDEGIDPGTEWDDNIATHIEKCDYFIALISDAYIKSSNCKDELNFARDLEKKRLLVYLEDVELPAGMRMRLSRLQAIHMYRYDIYEEFLDKLFSADGIASFKSAAVREVKTETVKAAEVVKEVKAIKPASNMGDFEIRGTELVKYKGNGAVVTIPDGITKIGNMAFHACKTIASVHIPATVTEIGNFAFDLCSSLVKVSLPDSLVKIGQDAFSFCSIQHLRLPKSLEVIGPGGFGYCKSLKMVEFPSGLKRIEKRAFYECPLLDSIEIPSGVEHIGVAAFSGTSIKTVDFMGRRDYSGIFDGQLLSMIPDGRYMYKDFVIKEGVLYKYLGNEVYVSIPNTVHQIAEGAMEKNQNIVSVSIPNSVTKLFEFSFSRCPKLQNVQFPDNNIEIGRYAFDTCTSIKTIKIPKNCQVYDHAFADCSFVRVDFCGRTDFSKIADKALLAHKK